jgi:hypothetical protein
MVIRVSDHALLRHLERVGYVDVEGLRAALVEQLARGVGTARQIGADHYVVRFSDAGYVVKNGVVVTVLTNRMGSAALGAEASGKTR